MDSYKSKSKNTFLNAVSSIILTIINGTFGIIITRMIINNYGSDFNGLNSTANHLVNILLIIEGGFTIAANVALFSPLSRYDYSAINSILYFISIRFKTISIKFLTIGILISIIYALTVKTNLSIILIFTVIIMAIIPAFINLYFTSTYRIILLSLQYEYIITIFTIFSLSIGYFFTVIYIYNGGNIWFVRFFIMISSIINSFIIVYYVKIKYKKFKIDCTSYDNKKITVQGINDVMIQKITNVIYSSAPIVYLSILPCYGTLSASIYAVYNNIFLLVKSLLYGIIGSARLSLGQMLQENDKEKSLIIFLRYELLTLILVFSLVTTIFALILPFISLYTKEVIDANYYNEKIAFLMSLITIIEMIHIPSGHIINMSGNFKVGKNIQSLACITLVILFIIIFNFFTIYNLLYSILLVACLLAFLEIWFVHIVFFKRCLFVFFKMITPLMIISIILSYFEKEICISIHTVTGWIFASILIVLINISCVIIVCFFTNKRQTLDLFQWLSHLLRVI